MALVFAVLAAACVGADGSAPSDEADQTDQTDQADAAVTTPIENLPTPDATPVELSADVTIGTLDNGLDYYIMTNDSPGGQAELLLVVDAGSAQQQVADSGGAHFLEHMMFNGTEEFPANELDAVLRGLGVEIGPDLNAYTSFDETVYQLGLPSAAEGNLELGFRVLAQWAGAATINQADVEAERGVVREEFRLRSETGSAAINERLFEIYTQDSGYEGHLPIGSDEKILATNAEELRRFYDDWYRPDNMAVIAVGDFNPDDVERLIKQELSHLTNRGSSPERLPVEAGLLTGSVVEIVAREGGPEPSISLDYQLPNWDPSTVGGQRMLLADSLIGSMLNTYLDELAADGTLDIVRPFVEPFEFTRSRRFLGMNVAASDYAAGATDLMRAIQTAQVVGFTQDHLDQAREQVATGVAQTVASYDTRQDVEFADEIVAYVLGGTPLESIEAWEDRVTEQIDSFTINELNQLFSVELARTVPLFTLIGSDPSQLPSQAELEAAVAAGMEADLIEQREAVAIDQLIGRPDGPSAIEDGEIWGFSDDHFWLFDNGVSVLFWDSQIAANHVDVWFLSPFGLESLSVRQSGLADMAVTAVTQSGVAGFDQVSLDRYLAAHSVQLSPFIDLRLQGLSGSAASEDLPVLFELIAAYYTDPQISNSGMAVARNHMEASLRALETEPSLASFAVERETRFADTPNLIGIPNEADVEDATADELLELFKDRFSSPSELVVLVVGDVDLGTVEDLASDYVASLPQGPADALPATTGYPAGPIELTVDAGLNNSGAGFDRYYRREGVLTRKQHVQAELLAGIINDRLFSRVREELGASYGGGNAVLANGPLNSFDTSFTISVDGDPARLDEIKAVVDEELDVLRSAGPSDVDLAEAKAVLTNDVQLVDNFELMSILLDVVYSNEEVVAFAEEEIIAATTAADIRVLAELLMDEANLVEVTRQGGGQP